MVVDKDGKHVRGLKAADFAVLDRDKPQTIATFEEVSHERPREAAPAPLLTRPARLDVGNNQTARSDRLVVMVIDDLHIYKGRTERAQDIARQIVSQLGPQASMAVLFTSANRNTQVTEDRAELLAAIDTLRGRQSVRRPNQARDDQKAPAGDPEQDALARLDAIGKAQEVSLQQFSDNMTQYKTLEDAARILGSDDARRKAFVLVSEGIGKDLTGVFDRALTPCEARCPTCPCFHDRALGEMMESLRRSSVTTYAIDPRGHVSPQGLALEAVPAPPRRGRRSSDRRVQMEQPDSSGTGRPDDHGRSHRGLRGHRHGRLHVWPRIASSRISITTTCSASIRAIQAGRQVSSPASREPPDQAATTGRSR